MIFFAATNLSQSVYGVTLRGRLDPIQVAMTENKVRSQLAEKSGHLLSVFLTRDPGKPMAIGLQLRHGHNKGMGLEVEAVDPKSAGASAGIVVGDIITNPDSLTLLQKRLADASLSGQKLPIIVQRYGKQIKLFLRVGLDIEDFGISLVKAKHSSGGRSCMVYKITDIEPGSIAGKAEPRLSKGDVLIGVDGLSLLSQHKEAMQAFDTKVKVLLSIFHGDEFECPVSPNSVSNQPQHIETHKLLPPSGRLKRLISSANASDVLAHMNIVAQEVRKMHGRSGAKCNKCTQSILHHIRKALETEIGTEPSPSVVHHHDLPKEGISLECENIQERCGKSHPEEANLVCGSDGNTYHRPCILQYHSCKRMKAAASAGENPLDAAINVVSKGHCSPCRQVTLGKNDLLPGPSFGLSIGAYYSTKGDSLPQIRSVLPGSAAATSLLVHEGEVIISVGKRKMCNSWDINLLRDTLKNADIVKLSVCTTDAAVKAAPATCPKATLPLCKQVLINDPSMLGSLGNIDSRVGQCGAFPVLSSDVWDSTESTTLLIPQGHVIFSLNKEVLCNKDTKNVRKVLLNTSGRSLELEVCPPEAIDSEFVCSNICKATDVINMEQEENLGKEQISNMEDEQEEGQSQDGQKQDQDVGSAVEYDKKNLPKEEPSVKQIYFDTQDLLAPECRRVEIHRSKVKYGLDIHERNYGGTRNLVVSSIHRGRGIDNVDILVGDEVTMIDNIPADSFQNMKAIQERMGKLDMVDLWIKRPSLPHDVKRTLRRDPVGFGLSFASTEKMSCGVSMPSVRSFDTLMHGVHNTGTGTQLLYNGDIIVRHGATFACDETAEEVARHIQRENSSVQLDLCPGGIENLKLYEAALCRICKPTTVPKSQERSMQQDRKEEEEINEEETFGSPGEVNTRNNSATGGTDVTEEKRDDLETRCIDSGRKWCGYTPQLDFNSSEMDQSLNCVGILEYCPLHFPAINPKELVKFCQGPDGIDPRLCSRALMNYTFPALPEPELEPDPKLNRTRATLIIAKEIKPTLEKSGQVCRPGGFCPYGDCPENYEKTTDNYCAPGKGAPRPAPRDIDHTCIPGQWCPPGYKCPDGFELKVSGKDGFCFEKTRQGPTVEPDFLGADFTGI